jgi:6-phosphogluconolactonase
MEHNNIINFGSPEELAAGFAKILSEKIVDMLATKDDLNFALSGGNTPIELFKILAADYSAKIEWNKLNFYWVDERCVPPDSPDSNFGNAYNTLFRNINISPARLHRIKGEADPKKEAIRYSDLVKHNVPQNGTLPHFDIILLGLGDDGHTASIFPNQMQLLTSEKLYETAIQPITGNTRITMTGNLINNAKCIYFLVSGKGKSEVVNAILNSSEAADEYPANFIKAEDGELVWVVDKSAVES